MKCFLNCLILLVLLFSSISFAAFEKIEGLEYDLRKIVDVSIKRQILKNFDLYELYFENRSSNAFSIPGYSIDLGVNYSTFSEVSYYFKEKTKKKFAILNIVAGAASVAFGGIPRIAASTAVRSVDTFRARGKNLTEDSNFLSPNRTYILYPGDALSLFLFVDKELGQIPSTIRFICREEETSTTHIVINNNVYLRKYSVKGEYYLDNKEEENPSDDVIALPEVDGYK